MPPSIVVAGDLVWDYNLVRHPGVPAHHHHPLRETVLDCRCGGAWFVADLVRLACADLALGPDAVAEPARRPPELATTCRVSRAWSLWEPCPATNRDDDRSRTWRISDFLGCQPAPSAQQGCAIVGDTPDPEVLVLDDLDLGFRGDPDAWPRAVREGGDPAHVVLKTVAPFGDGKLWARLQELQLMDRLTVVVSATALRSRAPLSHGLSWDRTIEDTAREMLDGMSARDLGRCRRVVVQLESEGAAVFGRPVGSPHATADLERFLYHPDDPEGTWRERHPGTVSGSTSILTAAVVRHVLAPGSYPLFVALARGLGAIRANHHAGGGTFGSGGGDGTFDPDAGRRGIELAYHPTPPGADGKGGTPDPTATYYAAFPHGLLSDPTLKARGPNESDLLQDLTGAGREYVYAKAVEVVLRGADVALAPAPKARFAKYCTVDRQEIERINAIRGLILAYRANPADTRPLSIAVFGAPGTGKSFAIKQLATAVLGKSSPPLEFNLSQWDPRSSDLHQAFHQVRDASLRGALPLVFWDEFDSADLTWLKHFLAPMQDAEFREGSVSHPFGKCIFVFAGGTRHSLGAFLSRSDDPAFVVAKGPDFISRLRGFVDIKGPNPLPDDPAEPARSPRDSSWEARADRDPAHIVRRALLLRGAIERIAGHLIDPRTKLASIGANVVHAFLRVDRYRFGARSLESVVAMSRLSGSLHFAAAQLPPAELLRLHVTDDFVALLSQGQLEAPVVEVLAKACHTAWYEEKKADDWRPGPVRSDTRKEHPLMYPWDDPRLPEYGRAQSRLTARLTQAKLRQLGFDVVRDGTGASSPLGDADLQDLMEIEHDIWLRTRLLHGWEYAAKSDEALRLHRDVAAFAAVPAPDRALDHVIAASIVPALASVGFHLRRSP